MLMLGRAELPSPIARLRRPFVSGRAEAALSRFCAALVGRWSPLQVLSRRPALSPAFSSLPTASAMFHISLLGDLAFWQPVRTCALRPCSHHRKQHRRKRTIMVMVRWAREHCCCQAHGALPALRLFVGEAQAASRAATRSVLGLLWIGMWPECTRQRLRRRCLSDAAPCLAPQVQRKRHQMQGSESAPHRCCARVARAAEPSSCSCARLAAASLGRCACARDCLSFRRA